MNVKIKTTLNFDRDFHKLQKKYKSLVSDLKEFIKNLENQNVKGDEVIKGVFKYRMAITSKGKGKSGGSRIITCEEDLYGEFKVITLLTIYDKSYRSTITKAEILDLQKRAGIISYGHP